MRNELQDGLQYQLLAPPCKAPTLQPSKLCHGAYLLAIGNPVFHASSLHYPVVYNKKKICSYNSSGRITTNYDLATYNIARDSCQTYIDILGHLCRCSGRVFTSLQWQDKRRLVLAERTSIQSHVYHLLLQAWDTSLEYYKDQPYKF